MVELLQEGVILLVSIILGASLLSLTQPEFISIDKILAEEGGKRLLKDFKRLLNAHDFLIEMRIENDNFHIIYDGESLSLKMYGHEFSTPARLGIYPFEFGGNGTIRFDGVGWKVVG